MQRRDVFSVFCFPDVVVAVIIAQRRIFEPVAVAVRCGRTGITGITVTTQPCGILSVSVRVSMPMLLLLSC